MKLIRRYLLNLQTQSLGFFACLTDVQILLALVATLVCVLAQCVVTFGAEPRSWFDGDAEPAPAAVAPPAKHVIEKLPPYKAKACLDKDLEVIEQAKPKPKTGGVRLSPEAQARMVKPQTFAERLGGAIRGSASIPPETVAAFRHAPEKQRLVGYIAPGGDTSIMLRFQNHPQFAIDWREEAPPDLDYYPAIMDPEAGYYFHNGAIDSWGTLLKRMNARRRDENLTLYGEPNRAFSLGLTLDRQLVLDVIRYLGDAGVHRRTRGQPIPPFRYGAVSLHFPTLYEIAFDSNQNTWWARFTEAKPTLHLLGVETPSQVDGITVTGDRLTFNVDWAPDAYVELRDGR